MIPVVAIGASAGGLKEFEQFFKNMPSTKELAFVIIQHLAPDYKSILADIVNRYTAMDVCQIENKMKVQPGKVYIIPPNNLVLLDKDKLVLKEMEKKQGINLPIDVFFRSMKDDIGEKSVAVILSGTGSDGTLGIKEVKEAGGLTIVQQPDTAEYDGMPTSAIRTGLIDYVIPVEEMPKVILNYIENEFQENRIITDDKKSESLINQVFEIIKSQTGHDFTNYKRNTIYRRIERRLTVKKLNKLQDYIKLLKEDGAEVGILYKELLISVTSFFRDKETFAYIEKNIIPKVVSGTGNNNLRIWVPACATGEEAYTWAILFKKYIDDNKLNIDLQIFASDIDTDAIEKGREGFYTNNIVADVPKEILERYFKQENNGFRIKKSIRETVIYADQNLLQDPPYSRLDLISCRNLLIYLDNYLQQKAISIFHYALKSTGHLVLGNSESLGSSAQFYEVIDRKYKVFRKINNIETSGRVWNMIYERQTVKQAEKAFHEPISEIAKEFILETQAPPSVVIDSEGAMLYAQGKTGKFLEITTGEISSNIVKTAKAGLKIPLSNLLRKARKTVTEVSHNNIKLNTDDDFEYVDITITPLKNNRKDTKLFVVFFKPGKSITKNSTADDGKNTDHVAIYELEKELAEKEQYLQNTIEELETTNEELKSSNEEAQSTNEELQSTNEELETSKEELQSVNEELTTTNNELAIKVDELNKVNSQLQNLLSATDIATIFLDRDLRIFNFTPAISIIIDLLHTDIGRSIKQFTNNLKYEYLFEDAKGVLKNLIPKEVEVETNDDRSFWMRIIPYRTVDDKIEGVVITFTDITEKKEAEIKLKESEEKYRSTYENSPDSIIIHDFEMNIVDVNQKAIKEFGYSKEEFLQMKVFDLHTKDELTHSKEVLDEMNKQEMLKVDTKFQRKDGSIFWADASPCKYELNGRPIIHVVIRNITELVDARNELQKHYYHLEELVEEKSRELKISERKFRNIAENIPGLVVKYKLSPAGAEELLYLSKNVEEVYEVPHAEAINNINLLWERIHPDDLDGYKKLLEKSASELSFWKTELRLRMPDGRIKWLDARGVPNKGEDGSIIWDIIGIDISDRKKADEKLLINQHYLQKAQEIGAIGTWHFDLEKNILSWTEENYKIFGIEPDTQMNYKLFMECVHPDDREFVDRNWKKGIENNLYDIEHRIIAFGKTKWVREKAAFIFNDDGKVIQAFGVAQDITDRKKVEEALVVAKKKAEENDKLKSAFLANMSHEIRTPMNGLIGFADLLKEKDLSDEERNYFIDIIQTNSNNLLNLINDIIDISKIEAGQLNIRLKPCKPANIIRDLEETFNQIKKQKDKTHIQFVARVSKKDANLQIETDPERLKQVLTNLLGNALKFTDNGTIEFGFAVSNNKVKFFVKDEGAGINKKDLNSIFNRFERADNADKKVVEGTGLGLSISKGIVELLQGQIDVKSTAGKGTTFEFYIPFIEVKGENKSTPKEQEVDFNKFKGKTIVVAEDDIFNLQLFKVILENTPATVLYAENGKEVVEIVDKNPDIDIILMDIRMPVMDGVEAARIILNNNPKIKIIAQTAHAMVYDKDKFLKSGFVDYLSKPISREMLFKKLAQWVQ